MDNLTIEKVLPYIPHGLKFKVDVLDKIFEATGIRDQGIITDGDWEEHWYGFSESQPLLRSLKSLSSPLTHKGKTFTPILELARIFAHRCTLNSTVQQIGDTLVVFEYSALNGSLLHMVAFHFEGPRLANVTNFIRDPNMGEYLLMFEKMHEWFFDTEGLIDKGLALDLETHS